MKVVHVITNLGIGGAEKMLYNFLLEEKKRGSSIEHLVFCFYEGIIAEKLQAAGFQVTQLTGLFHQYDPWSLRRFLNVLKAEKPDILHGSLWSANLFVRLAGYFLNIPVICDMHSDPTFHGFLRNFLDKVTHRSSIDYVAVSSNIARSYKARLPDATITTIFNGVTIPPERSEISRTIKNKTFLETDIVVGACGRLIPLKRYALLLYAMRHILDQKIDNVYALIVGDGPSRIVLEELAQKLNVLDHIFFVGQQNDMSNWYPLFNMLVSCSDTEGMSMVILEALAHGCPVITNQNANADQIVKDKKTGLVLSDNSSPAIAAAIIQLSKDKTLRECLKQEAQKEILASFSIERSVDQYKKLYKKRINSSFF